MAFKLFKSITTLTTFITTQQMIQPYLAHEKTHVSQTKTGVNTEKWPGPIRRTRIHIWYARFPYKMNLETLGLSTGPIHFEHLYPGKSVSFMDSNCPNNKWVMEIIMHTKWTYISRQQPEHKLSVTNPLYNGLQLVDFSLVKLMYIYIYRVNS